MIDVPAVEEPHQGSSYNPPVSAHQELLRSAHEIEEQRFKTAEEHKIIRDRVASARHVENEENDGFLPTGMSLDPLNEDDVELEESADGEDKVSKLPTRKTKQQRRKAEKQRVEVQLFTLNVSFVSYLAFRNARSLINSLNDVYSHLLRLQKRSGNR